MARLKTAAGASLEDVRTILRNKSLRATTSRVAVLRRLLQLATPVSHSELADALAHEAWDRATIYRNLTDLTEAGLVRRTDLGDHVWRFEIVREGGTEKDGAHPHFVCEDCGVVQCLPNRAVQVHVARSAPRALRRREVHIQFRGVCDRCA